MTSVGEGLKTFGGTKKICNLQIVSLDVRKSLNERVVVLKVMNETESFDLKTLQGNKLKF